MKNFKVVTPSYTVRIGKNGKYTKESFSDCHEAKSKAGIKFHESEVDSAAVFDNFQTLYLYLQKTPHGVIRQELPSSEAL